MRFAFSIVLALLLFSLPALAVITQATLPIYAVIAEGQSALKADLIVNLELGTGKIYSGVGPLVGTATQSSERTAVELAKNYSSLAKNYDYKFDINSDASIVDGPSAGSAISLLVVTMLQNKRIPEYVAITGTIDSDGRIGPVGGVFEKAKKASETGIKLFLIPEGEALQTRRFDDGIHTIDLAEYALSEWGMKVIEVSNLDEALSLAFTNIENIDVNSYIQAREPEFIPTGISLNSKLEVMHVLTSKYLEKVDSSINSARGSLSNTIMSRTEILNTLLESLNSSEQTLGTAKILLDQNYLYSAANSGYLAMVNAFMVEDISNDPSLLELNSLALQNKSEKLLTEINQFSIRLDKAIPLDSLEWYIAAQERLSWAKLSLQQLTTSQIVVVGQDAQSELVSAIENLRKYEFARAWFDIAQDFYNVTIQTNGSRIKLNELFTENAQQAIIRAQNLTQNLVNDEENEDVFRRLNASLYQQGKGWLVSAAVDAASAEALALVKAETQDKSLPELLDALTIRVQSLEQKIAESGKEFVWPQLYLDHAKYFLNAANYYQTQNSTVRALDSARGGISLIFLADHLFETIHSAYDLSEIAEVETYVSTDTGSGTNSIGPALNSSFFLILIPILAFLAILGLIYFYIHSKSLPEKSFFPNNNEKQVQIMLVNLDKAFAENKISNQQYAELTVQYKQMLSEIKLGKEEHSRHVTELDKLKSELVASQHTLHELKRHYLTGQIVKEDYEKNLHYYAEHTQALAKEIDAEKQALKKSNSKKLNSINSLAVVPVQSIQSVPKTELMNVPKTESKSEKSKRKPKTKK
ncbi:MAG: S16 family serine protease [Candidatus Diapherotrites archaeon]|nr:S16 family serine protease [Candidatus Diapherotrites archaeon]